MSAPQRVVLVTGASSGIGQTCAALLAGRGYRVYGASRSAGSSDVSTKHPQQAAVARGSDSINRDPDLPNRVEPLRSNGTGRLPSNDIVPITMDVTQDESVRRACEAILEREGRLDVLINSAGMGIAGALEDTSPDEARDQFEVNLFGVLRVCRAALPVMRRQRSGHIVNIGSIGGLVAIPYQSMYSASKFALEGLTESLRMEVKPFGIRVVLIEPGDHRTGFTQNRVITREASGNPAYRAAFDQAIQRMATDEQSGPSPDRIAHIVGRVIEKRNPRLRYATGPASQRAAIWLKRLGPHRLIEKIVGGYYSR